MSLQTRPPVIAILGHVDHGKTSLLDYIRHAKVAAGEAGGITQHIGAYQAEQSGQKLTFIDTPGHAAFSEMRSRGANVTDIAVLVVAADDGVMPQTIESIKHIQHAKVPMVVAINKMDLPDADSAAIKAQLTEHSVFVTGYGGDTEVVEISAKTGLGVDKLLDTLITLGEILELKANPDASAQAVVIESKRDKHRGSMATVIVKNGTLKVRDSLFTPTGANGQVRSLTDAAGSSLTAAAPAMPVEVTGFADIPLVGSMVTTVPQEAEEAAQSTVAAPAMPMFGAESETPKLHLIIKADFTGTLEAIVQSIPQDQVEILATGVGDVTESDVSLAETSKSVIVTFNTKAPGTVAKIAERARVKIKSYRIIYEMLDDIQELIKKAQEPESNEVVTGEAEVLQIFDIRGTLILGSRVISGELRKGDKAHVKRGDEVVYDGMIASLKEGKADVDLATEGMEFGAVITTKQKNVRPQVGDIISAYKLSDF